MAALKNQKHELFAQNILLSTKYGWTQGAAYSRAGYRAEGEAAETNASRLLKNAQVKARIAELAEPAARKAKVTVATPVDQLDPVFDGATGDKFGAAASAVTTKAKLMGHLRDKIEIGAPGSFRTRHSHGNESPPEWPAGFGSLVCRAATHCRREVADQD